MARSTWLHILIAVAGALAVLLFVRLHHANGARCRQTAPRPGIVSPRHGARIVTRSRL